MTDIIEIGEVIEIVEVENVIELLDLDGGVQGLPGTAATVEIGNVTTGSPSSVTNVGTPTAAILDIVLEQGEPGYAPLVEYSSDGISWHTPYEGTDLYIHFSMDNGSTWGDTIALAVYTMTWLGSGD